MFWQLFVTDHRLRSLVTNNCIKLTENSTQKTINVNDALMPGISVFTSEIRRSPSLVKQVISLSTNNIPYSKDWRHC
jgi:hypothetical protein